jgi:uncharacterized protein YkwD
MKKNYFSIVLCCFVCGVFMCCSSARALPFQEWNTLERQVLDLVNLQRSHRGLTWLKANDELQEAARLHSLDMGSNNYFSHTSQDGTTFDERVTAQGYQWNHVGENIAAGYPDAHAVMYGTNDLSALSDFDESRGYGGFASWSEVGDNWTDSDWDAWEVQRNNNGGWMGSSGHRQNILNPDFVDIGIGYAYAESSHYHRYWTQDFGTGDSNPEEIPSTPQPPSASDGTYQNYVQISWNVASNVDNYLIVRCTDQGLDNCVEIYRGETIKTMDETAEDMVSYFYRMRVCNVSGCSEYSSFDSGYRNSKLIPGSSRANIISVIQLLLRAN